MKIGLAVTTMLVLAGTPVLAHRLDEYLQGVMISVERERVQARITLTPGVAVLPAVLAEIDTDADGIIAETEQRAYAGRVLRDVSLTIDGHPLTPQLLSMQFPPIEEMKEGRGEIQIEFGAGLPPGGPNRSLIFKNNHQSRIAAYQVNSLLPNDPNIRIVAQNRNYSQSFYQVDYTQAGRLSSAWWVDDRRWLGGVALVLLARFSLLWWRRAEHQNAVTALSRSAN